MPRIVDGFQLLFDAIHHVDEFVLVLAHHISWFRGFGGLSGSATTVT
ncbi:hypothetical protein RHOER0001_2853 [Rhodococcus erythropolis SK121]|nr:hypothetical protein RHOER0001_2853 [Rhodococcus erythropolis SK121]